MVIATYSKDLVYIDDPKPSAGIGYGDQAEYSFYVSETLRQLVDEGEGIFMSAFKYGVADRKGNVVLDFKYTYLSGLRGGKMFAHGPGDKGSQMGILDDKGNWVVVMKAIINS